METTIGYPREIDRRRSWLGLAGLVLGLLAGAVVLYALAGPPRLPAEIPDWSAVVATLQGSYLPSEAVAYAATTAAWALWFWIVASLVLRVVALVAEYVASGAAWARALRVLSDWLTLPLVRRLVDGAIVAIIVVNLAGRGVGSAAAAPLSTSASAVVAWVPGEAEGTAPRGAERGRSERGVLEYTVRPGDTLWHIAERCYGSGHEFPRLVEANLGREMPDGARFSQAGVIRPGWVLAVPDALPQDSQWQPYYDVKPGDTLRSIALWALGDEMRWPEIFDLNRGTARLADGRVLTDPDLIWPGLRLRLPQEQRSAEVAPPKPDARPQATPVATATATSTLVTPSPEPTPTTVVLPTVQSEEPADGPADHGSGTSSSLAVAAAGLAAVAGGALILARRRVRRSLAEPPIGYQEEMPDLIAEGFAQADFVRAFSHRLHSGEVEPVQTMAEAILHALAERGLPQLSILMASHSRGAAALTLSGGLGERDRLIQVAPEVGVALGGSARAEHTLDHDVALRLADLRMVGLCSPRAERPGQESPLLPIGVQAGREALYANWRELGHVLAASTAGGDVPTILTSLICALAARFRPDELQLRIVAGRHVLPDELTALPHLHGDIVEPANGEDIARAFYETHAELDRRMELAATHAAPQTGIVPEWPELVLVFGELADLEDRKSDLHTLGVHGPAYGIRIVAASERLESLGDDLLAHFPTRLVLQTQDEEQSIRLVGRPDAADLGGGGDLLARIAGRAPVRLRGLKISTEQIGQLVAAMGEAYPFRQGPVRVEPGVANPEPISDANQLQAVAGSKPSDTRPEPTNQSPTVAAVSTELASPSSPEPSATIEEAESTAEPSPETLAPVTERSDQPLVGPANAVPLIEVKCFGTFRVVAGGRELSPDGAGGGQYKAWEVLAFLAAQPGGACSKEKLLGALWPDVDPEKASGRLKVTLFRLRQVLGQQVQGLTAEVVRSERNGVCRLDMELIASDACRFWELCRPVFRLAPAEAKATYEEARALYQGDLLAEPLYEWNHARDEGGLSLQERYREEYYRITRELAALNRRQGQTALAVPVYKSILKVEPTLEDVVRDLYHCYRELGDRSSLIREDRRLRQALREAYGNPDDPEDDLDLYQPEPETVDLYEEALADIEARAAVRSRR
ncbi:MAG: LysM peptidoglycan-binding domain-containing protein [Chloroflexota bacterium]